MCYSTAYEKELEAMERDYNRRMLEDSRRAYLHPDELDENYDPDRSILFKQTSAFARPFWPVISSDRPDVIDMYRWGFFPPHIRTEEEAKVYIKDYPSFNAVSEDVETKRTFKDAWAKGQRCLIPVTSFFEWQNQEVPGRKTPNKIPYRIGTKEPSFSLGGLWADTGLGYRVYTILTTKANPLMDVIHNKKKRQPVIIPKDMEEFWLSRTLPLDHVKLLCDPIPEGEMVAEAA